MESTYNPKQIEDKIYAKWLEKKYFHAVADKNKKPYTIVIPPPNITGQLHMGHALDNMIQDCIIRTKRMQGYCALWMPGTDHASIATEVKIVEALNEEGTTKEELGREGFLKRAWQWKEQYGGKIVQQLKKLGSSLDWERERFTMDEGCNKAVTEVFINLYNKGLIYQGNRIINWCPTCQTALSDAEVNYEEKQSHLWYVKYFSEDKTQSITVATTRPETMLGDTAVAVNPKDERYKDLIGKNVILPLLNKPIPVVADDYVDMEFGTGAVKITPAHDPNDYEVAMRHNLPIIRVLDDGGVVNDLGGKYCGLERYEARKQIINDLQTSGELVKIEDYTHNVGGCYRCSTVIEPIISKQWFVSMKALAQPALDVVKNGEVKFVPEKYAKTYYNWLENIKDWCVSRQLWWGHRIPAFYCDDCGTLTVAKTPPSKCENCGCTAFTQDEDVLDTWFSSGMWPFSTLGWPDKNEDLEFFYPTNVLVTAYDIIFFWVARMMIFGIEVMGKPPFEFINIHGIVRDSQGRKMSKSLNNGIDPLEVIDKYGADALRFSLAIGISPGNDMRFYYEKVEAARNFANKIWNASRFVMMNVEGEIPPIDETKLDIADKWLLTNLNTLITEATDCIEKFDLGLAAQKIYDFSWSEFCDWYIEMSKPRLYNEPKDVNTLSVLVYALKNILKLLHPFMPFITEEIYLNLPNSEETIMTSSWPTVKFSGYENQAHMMGTVMEMIRKIRAMRAEMNVSPGVKVKVSVLTQNAPAIDACAEYIKKLGYASEVEIVEQSPKNCVSVVCEAGEAFMPLAELIDIGQETERIKKEIETTKKEIMRAEGKLNNEGFTKKAPANVIEEEREKVGKYKGILEKLEERLLFLQKL